MHNTEEDEKEIASILLRIFRLDPVKWFDTACGWAAGMVRFIARMLGNND